MNETIKSVLSLSLSGSLLILILILYLLRPLFKERLSRRWQYYIWLVVVRLLLPFAPETNLMGTLFQGIDKGVEQKEFVPSPDQGAPSVPEGVMQKSSDMEMNRVILRMDSQRQWLPPPIRRRISWQLFYKIYGLAGW